MKLSFETRTDTYYSAEVYTSHKDYAPSLRRRFDSWQAAYSYASNAIYEDCGIAKVNIVRRTHDACIYRGLRTYRRSSEPQFYAAGGISIDQRG